MPGAKRITAMFLALLLPLAAAAENTVEVLPTSPPMPVPAIKTNDYAFEDLAPLYEQSSLCAPYMLPSLTETEKQRLSEAQRRLDAGEQPESSILNQLENIILSLVLLPAEQYEGEEWYLILPCRELKDSELLQLVAAFREAGVYFEPDMLNWHNCMRGGFITETRSQKSDERERYSALGEQFFRAGLRPETPYTPSVTDDGIGRVALAGSADTDLFNGLEYFDFLPARRLTDEELLRIYALDNSGQISSPDEINSYELQLRQELSSRLGMPLSAIRGIASERIGTLDNYWGDSRITYFAGFTEKSDNTGYSWNGNIDISTGRLVMATIDIGPSPSLETGQYSDIRMDPWDPVWSETARQTVSALCRDDSVGISQVQSWGDININNICNCAEIRVIMTDGAVCIVYVSYLTGAVLWIDYYDAACIAQLDNYNSCTYGKGVDTSEE